MKIQCDVCSQDEAMVFCYADEAALCKLCDHKVHNANKLASKHRRFDVSSSTQTNQLCDICKEKRVFVFCQEDRALLCCSCDDSIHSANKTTSKHSRFLLTGAGVSVVDDSDTNIVHDKPKSIQEILVVNNGSCNSSISEYLINILPGYCVEDLLVDDDVDVLYKNDEMFLPCLETDLEAIKEFQISVPYVPQMQFLDFAQSSINAESTNYIYFGEREITSESTV